ncbi:M20/M25/M40 family metallo-hydrolase [Thalassotalea ganghwensis]
MKKIILTLFILTSTLLLFCSKSIAIPLNKHEKNIIKQVKAHLPATLKSLESAVNINSGTMNFEGVEQVAKLYIPQFQRIGFNAEFISGKAFNRAGHLIASRLSDDPTAIKVLLIGHLDTVFAKHDDFQSFSLKGKEQATGPGIVDMKGGNAIIIAALESLERSNLLDTISIKVVMTGDEENSGRPLQLSKAAIIDAAKWADIALGFENGDSNIKTAMVARRGYVGWQLQVSGKPAHSSQIFREDIGYGAIYEAARIITDFREKLSTQENLTFNPGLIVGGTQTEYFPDKSSATAYGKTNVIAKEATVIGDIRALSMTQFEQAKQIMQHIVSENLPHTEAKLTFDNGYPPMSPTPGNHQLLTMYSRISTDLGYETVVAANPRKAGAADISFAAEHVEMAIDGIGLMGCCGHTDQEVADLTSLQKNIEKAAILLYRLSNTDLSK